MTDQTAAPALTNDQCRAYIDTNESMYDVLRRVYAEGFNASQARAAQSQRKQSDTIDMLKEEVERYRKAYELAVARADGEFWAWQGDGTDNLASLACPVMIQPDALREIAQSPTTPDGRVAKDLLGRISSAIWPHRDALTPGVSYRLSVRARYDGEVLFTEGVEQVEIKRFEYVNHVEYELVGEASPAGEARACGLKPITVYRSAGEPYSLYYRHPEDFDRRMLPLAD